MRKAFDPTRISAIPLPVKSAFARKGHDVMTEELVAVLSRNTAMEFKDGFELVYANQLARNAANGGGGKYNCRQELFLMVAGYCHPSPFKQAIPIGMRHWLESGATRRFGTIHGPCGLGCASQRPPAKPGA